MAKFSFLIVLTFSSFLSIATATLVGPFLLWGIPNLSSTKAPGLNPIQWSRLRDIYDEASSIVIFVKNSTTPYTEENYPKLSAFIKSSDSLYLPQHELTLDPVKYHKSVQIQILEGSPEEQEEFITSYFKTITDQYENGKVLGILANQLHYAISKRYATAEETAQIYMVRNKAMLASYSAPLLTITEDISNPEVLKLSKSVATTTETFPESLKLIVDFTSPENVRVEFVFNTLSSWWKLEQASVALRGLNVSLNVVGEAPSAPDYSSYGCVVPLKFRNEKYVLSLGKFQVQKALHGTRFGSVYDCIGVTSPGILCGAFVMSILAIVLTIGITALMSIKTPNKFENRNSKPLTFVAQE